MAEAHFSDKSVNGTVDPPFNHQSVILFLRNKIFNYLSLDDAEKNSQMVFKHTAIFIFAFLTLLAPPKLSDNCTA